MKVIRIEDPLHPLFKPEFVLRGHAFLVRTDGRDYPYQFYIKDNKIKSY